MLSKQDLVAELETVRRSVDPSSDEVVVMAMAVQIAHMQNTIHGKLIEYQTCLHRARAYQGILEAGHTHHCTPVFHWDRSSP